MATHAQCFVPYTNQSLFVDLRVRNAPMKQNRVQRSGTREEEQRVMACSDHLSPRHCSGQQLGKGRNSRCFQPSTSLRLLSSPYLFIPFLTAVSPVSTALSQLLTQIKTFLPRDRFLPNLVTSPFILPPLFVDCFFRTRILLGYPTPQLNVPEWKQRLLPDLHPRSGQHSFLISSSKPASSLLFRILFLLALLLTRSLPSPIYGYLVLYTGSRQVVYSRNIAC